MAVEIESRLQVCSISMELARIFHSPINEMQAKVEEKSRIEDWKSI